MVLTGVTAGVVLALCAWPSEWPGQAYSFEELPIVALRRMYSEGMWSLPASSKRLVKEQCAHVRLVRAAVVGGFPVAIAGH